MVGGDLHWIWKPYAIYQEVDYVRRVVFDRADANVDRGAWGFSRTGVRRKGSARK